MINKKQIDMRKIGFKNFRKFADFPAMEFAPITILVGENNAGKSTVVKGILALSDFFDRSVELFDWYHEDVIDDTNEKNEAAKEKEYKRACKKALEDIKFYFNTSYLAHIGTFKRALYNKAEKNEIVFELSDMRGVSVSIFVTGDCKDEEAVSGTVSKICLYSRPYKISLEFDLKQDNVLLTFHPGSEIAARKDIPDFVRRYFNSFDKPYSIKTAISDFFISSRRDIINSLISSLESALSETILEKDIQKEKRHEMLRRGVIYSKPISGLDKDTRDFLKLYYKEICGESYFRSFPLHLRFTFGEYEYLYAHAVTQTVIYSSKDTNDYLSRTIHEFASQQHKEYKKKFILKWMKEFGIGTNFEIKSVGGEAHIVYITNKDRRKVNLADKGMGSIQLMVLLFRLAISLPKKTKLGYSRKIIIIEEPEQNLHPMLQSKLADLFYELNATYGYRFIIETHSEYLIRKTQVIVKDNFNDGKRPLRENPFKVYYFNASDSEKPYYEIEYQKDGCFSNDFGKGFFDEASNLAFEIL